MPCHDESTFKTSDRFFTLCMWAILFLFALPIVGREENVADKALNKFKVSISGWQNNEISAEKWNLFRWSIFKVWGMYARKCMGFQNGSNFMHEIFLCWYYNFMPSRRLALCFCGICCSNLIIEYFIYLALNATENGIATF